MKKRNSQIKNKYFLIASICFYIATIIFIFGENNLYNIMAVIDLCLGSCFLFLSMVDNNKDKKDKK